MVIRTLKFENFGDDTCQKCQKQVEDAVCISVDDGSERDTVSFVLCEECITSAVGDATGEGEDTVIQVNFEGEPEKAS